MEHADRLAGLHQQGLVALQPPQRGYHTIETFPVACRPTDAAIDDKLPRPLRHLGI
jgi:hypothetical protein